MQGHASAADGLPRRARERGDIVLGWLTRVVLALVAAGIVLFDVVSVAVARVSVADDANTAARAASEAYATERNVQGAYDAAAFAAGGRGESVAPLEFRVAPDGQVSLRLSRTARTVVLGRIGPLRHLGTVSANGRGRFLGS